MKLSVETLEILKNFSLINSNIVIDKGSILKTMAEAKNVLGSAVISETFPAQVGIYDLPEFLSAHSMFEDPDMVFADDMKYVTMSEGRSKVKYYFSDPEILTTPQKDLKMPSVDLKFTLTEENLSTIRKAVSALKVADLSITVEDGDLVAVAKDVKNKTSNSFTIDLGTKAEGQFNLIFSVANFKFLAGDYGVEISSKLISKFTHSASELAYFVALEKTSTFN